MKNLILFFLLVAGFTLEAQTAKNRSTLYSDTDALPTPITRAALAAHIKNIVASCVNLPELGTGVSTALGNSVDATGGFATYSTLAANQLSIDNTQTGTSYTLALSDAGKTVSISNASANMVTVPTNASVAFPVGAWLMVKQAGAGATSIAAAGGVTINAPSGLTVAGQGYYATLRKTATDTWDVVSGGTATGSSGTVTSVSIATANGVSGTVATPSTTPVITFSLGAIAPTSVNNITFTGPTVTRTVTFPDAATTVPTITQALTFSGPTAARTITLPDANFTVARTDAGQTFTGASTATSWNLVTPVIQGASASGASNIDLSGGTGYLRPPTGGLYLSGGQQRYLNNYSTTSQSPTAATRTYITGSNLAFTAGNIRVGTIFRWKFNLTKTAAGTAASTIDIAFGTAGTTADTARVSFTKPAGTAVVDEGWVTVEAIVRTNSSTGVVVGEFTMIHNLSATGHMTIPAACVNTVSSTFNTTTVTNVGLCITTGASDAITIQQCTAEAINL